ATPAAPVTPASPAKKGGRHAQQELLPRAHHELRGSGGSREPDSRCAAEHGDEGAGPGANAGGDSEPARAPGGADGPEAGVLSAAQDRHGEGKGAEDPGPVHREGQAGSEERAPRPFPGDAAAEAEAQ